MNLVFLLFWLVLSYALLFWFRFILASHFASLFFRLTGQPRWGQFIFNFLLLPGVMLHELSHFLTAAALGVPTGEISILPHQLEGKSRLGSVKIAQTDPLRESLIGAAPLLVASLVLVALTRWQFPALFIPVVSTNPLALVNQIWDKAREPQTWLWFYLLFAFANTMFTSESDRRAWPFMIGLFAILIALIFGLGLIDQLRPVLGRFLTIAVTQLNMAFSLTIGVDTLILTLLWLSQRFISRLSGKIASYGKY